MPFLPAAGSVTAKTMIDLAVLAGGDELLRCPTARSASPSRRALVRKAEASEPACGSVSAKPPIHSPLASLGRKRCLLRLGAELQDRHAGDGGMHADDGGAGAVAGGDLLQRERIGHHAGVRAAIAFRHQHAEKAELAHLLEFGFREGVGGVARRGGGRQPLAGEVAGGVANLGLDVGEDHRSAAISYSRSMATAVASPPPMHSAATPRFRSYFSQRRQQRHQDARAGGADRVAERAGAAMDVDLVVRQAEVVHRRQRHHRERLVDLEQIDVGEVPAGALGRACAWRRPARWGTGSGAWA